MTCPYPEMVHVKLTSVRNLVEFIGEVSAILEKGGMVDTATAVREHMRRLEMDWRIEQGGSE